MTVKPQLSFYLTILFKPWFLLLAVSLAGLAACSESGTGSRGPDTGVLLAATGGGGGSSGYTNISGSGGTVTTTGGSGGTTTISTGDSGGSIAGSGSLDASTADGGGANATGGAGGTQPTAGSGGAAGTGGGDTGGVGGGGGAAGSGDTCEKGQVEPGEVIIMGESFYGFFPYYIQRHIEENAKAAGALDANASYRNYSVPAQALTGTIPGQFDQALGVGPVKVVIMDGGGIDCMSSPCDACPGVFTTLLEKMANNGVQDVIYTRYPEPGNPPGSNTFLKQNLDILMPKMEPVCAAATGLRCHWVDLRPVWVDGDTDDGLHPTVSGGEHVGDAIWAKMVEECIAQ
jgi:hypothetical protein